MASYITSNKKLNRALVNAGLTSQQALAERIATLEGKPTESGPTTTINQAFRQQSISESSLHRIARGLGVEAEELLLDESTATDDLPSTDADPETEAVNERRDDTDASGSTPSSRSGLILGVGALLAILGVLFAVFGPFHRAPSERQPAASSTPNLGPRPAIAFAKAQSESAVLATDLLQVAMSDYWPILPSSPTVPFGNPPTGIDVVFEVSTIESSRYMALVIKSADDSSQQIIWTDALPANASDAYFRHRMSMAANAINLRFSQGIDTPFAPLSAQEEWLAGKASLDAGRTELSIRRAQSAFQSALREWPDWDQAHAGLCEAFVQEFLWSKDTAALTVAEASCADAKRLNRTSVEVDVAVGSLRRKQGVDEDAETHFAAALDLDAANVDTLLSFAELRLQQFMLGSRSGSGDEAGALADQATTLESSFWKTHYIRGRIHFLTGNVEGAIDSNTQSIAQLPTHQALNNLGAAQMCAGHFSQAVDAFTEAVAVYPQSHVNDVQLATASYFANDYEASMRLFRAAMDKQEAERAQEHRVVGGYADSLRHLQRDAEAITAYTQALNLVEKMIVKGEKNPMHRAHRAYYMSARDAVDPELTDALGVASVDRELSELETLSQTNSGVLILVAASRMLRSEEADARRLFEQSVDYCDGYRLLPELQPLATTVTDRVD
ncbi:MAG: tetratricopeptide repeat protein [Gammaproteobacteria bacterium]